MGHVENLEVQQVGKFDKATCLHGSQLDDPRAIHVALSQSFTLWNAGIISKKNLREQRRREEASDLGADLMKLCSHDMRKRVFIDKLAPRMAKGPVAREDMPQGSSEMQVLALGVKNLKDYKKVLKAAKRQAAEAEFDRADEATRAELTIHDYDQRPERDIKYKDRVQKTQGYKKGATEVEQDPSKFASFQGKSFATSLQLAGHSRQRLLGQKEPSEDDYGTIKERLRKLQAAKEKQDSGFQWRSKFAVK